MHPFELLYHPIERAHDFGLTRESNPKIILLLRHRPGLGGAFKVHFSRPVRFLKKHGWAGR